VRHKQVWIEIMAFTIRGTDYVLYATPEGVQGQHRLLKRTATSKRVLSQGGFQRVRSDLLAAIKGA